jgi:hypothetical protein
MNFSVLPQTSKSSKKIYLRDYKLSYRVDSNQATLKSKERQTGFSTLSLTLLRLQKIKALLPRSKTSNEKFKKF